MVEPPGDHGLFPLRNRALRTAPRLKSAEERGSAAAVRGAARVLFEPLPGDFHGIGAGAVEHALLRIPHIDRTLRNLHLVLLQRIAEEIEIRAAPDRVRESSGFGRPDHGGRVAVPLVNRDPKPAFTVETGQAAPLPQAGVGLDRNTGRTADDAVIPVPGIEAVDVEPGHVADDHFAHIEVGAVVFAVWTAAVRPAVFGAPELFHSARRIDDVVQLGKLLVDLALFGTDLL